MNLTRLTFLCAAASTLLPALRAAEPVEDFRFKVEKLAEGMPQPMELELAPDGRIFFNEYLGKLKYLNPATKAIVEVGTLQVFKDQENGFLGFALDPKFSENGWIYCLYSQPGVEMKKMPPEKVPANAKPGEDQMPFGLQRLSRFTIKGDTLDLTSEKLLLTYEEQRKDCCHHGGSVEFGPDGLLYFSAGDNTHPFGDSDSYAPIDERPGRLVFDAQKSAGNTNSLSGKVNRIRPKPDGTYEIPAGNLFPPGTPQTRPEIYAMGCRNPWRMSVDQKTGYVYWGEVGPDAHSDGPRGSRGYDEINQAKKAGNYGWPYFVGPSAPYNDYDFAAKKIGAKFDPAKPFNDSPNNTGLHDLPPATPAMIYWPYGKSKEWPILGEGGRTACAGPVYYSSENVDKTNGFPANFNRCLLFWDWERPFIKWARLDADSNLVGIEDFTKAIVVARGDGKAVKAAVAAGAVQMKRPVDAVFSPDGSLYILDYGETWGANPDSQLLKISYLRGNLPPIAKAAAKPLFGREPLTVDLSAEGSRDLEGDPLTYAWLLQPGNQPLGSTPTLHATIDKPGNYIVELRVSDNKGGVGTASLPLLVGNSAPTVQFDQPREGDFFTPEKKVSYRVSVTDQEDGPSSAKPDEFGLRTLVSTGFQRADGQEEAVDRGLSMMKQSDCFNCHAVEQKIVGPALLDIAAKYRGQPGALDASVKRVREGSANLWGPVPMLAHPQHTVDEVSIMLRWVFSLEKGKAATPLLRGLAGEVTAPKVDRPGLFVLEATYTDAGRAPAGQLSGKVQVRLRSRRQEAELGEIKGSKVMDLGKASGNRGVGGIDDGHSIKFTALNLSGTTTVTARTASAGAGGKIELHAGSPTGDLLATLDVPLTGKWDKWQEATAPFKKTEGPTDVYAVFVNPGKSGLMNLDWLQFNE